MKFLYKSGVGNVSSYSLIRLFGSEGCLSVVRREVSVRMVGNSFVELDWEEASSEVVRTSTNSVLNEDILVDRSILGRMNCVLVNECRMILFLLKVLFQLIVQ